MRTLALDHGTARIGCAISDPSGTLVTPLPTIEPPEPRSVATLVAEREVGRVVVGLPLHLSGEEGAQAGLVRSFCAELEALLDVPVETYDERLTTRMAEASRRDGATGAADSLAAAHLLEGYLAANPEDGKEAGMAEDWEHDDPFANPADPEAAAREERRREREEKRRKRQGKEPESPEPESPDPVSPEPEVSAPQPPPPKQPPPPPQPPVPPRTAEEEFWDEDPEPYEEEEEELPPAAPPPGGRPPRGPRQARPGAGVFGAILRHPFRVVAALVAIAAVWFLVSLFQPFHGDGSGRVVVQVPKGSGVGEVGDLLDERGVISNSTFFQLRVTLSGDRSNLKAGRFVLANDMSYGSAIEALTKSPVKKVSSVTIPEGFNREQTAALAAEDGLSGSYLKETVHSKYLNPAKYGGKGAKNLEGFLFPDTFEVKPGGPAADLVQLQLQDFQTRIKGVDMKYARSKNLTTYDVLTIASMVQAESGNPDQDALVAGVIYNRLHEGMPLGIDATVRFATGNYESPLTESELATDSPYNTRLNQGLPPGPINSPGLEAIEAAAHPSKKGYLFYVTKPGGCNELVFAKTEAEFESDVDRYNSAREAAGGNSPTTC